MKQKLPSLYLFLLPLYFVLFLYSTNISTLQPIDFIRPAIIALLLVVLIYLVTYLFTRQAGRATVLAAILWTAFSVYGHLYGFLRAQTGFLNILGKHSILGSFFVILVIALFILTIRSKNDFKTLNNSLNMILSVLVFVPIITITSHYLGALRDARSGESNNNPGYQTQPVALPNIQNKPDIYYIILDAYSRADVIKKHTGQDTSPFLGALRERGFFVADCSTSNYDFTIASLASSLNFSPLQDLDTRFVPENTNVALLEEYIRHSRVRATLEAAGYQSIAFSSGYSVTDIKDADIYLSPDHPSLLTPNVQPFESLWLKTTALRLLFDTHPPFLTVWLDNLSFPNSAHVARELYILDQLPKLAKIAGPKFIFAHILIPHAPFVFRADGSITKDSRYFREIYSQPVSQEYVIDGYSNQVAYINQRMLSIIDEIIANSAQPPIIILQGDHGLLYFEHAPILNAYYFPGDAKNALHPTITPVNSFRILFNEYFGTTLPVQPDQSYTSIPKHPYRFKPVQFDCPVK